jgi:hypothetical protein
MKHDQSDNTPWFVGWMEEARSTSDRVCAYGSDDDTDREFTTGAKWYRYD